MSREALDTWLDASEAVISDFEAQVAQQKAFLERPPEPLYEPQDIVFGWMYQYLEMRNG